MAVVVHCTAVQEAKNNIKESIKIGEKTERKSGQHAVDIVQAFHLP